MRMFRHFKRIIPAFLIIVAVMITGCGDTFVEKREIILATGGTAGTYFSAGGIMATVMNPLLKSSSLSVLSTGGSRENIRLLSEKEASLAIVQNDVMHYAHAGTDLYEDEGKIRGFSAVATLYDESLQIVTLRDDIKSVEDLKGRSVSVGDAGSGVEVNTKQVLEVFGLDFSDINVVNAPFDKSVNGLLDGTIDAAFIVAGAPTKAVTDLAGEVPVHLVGIDKEHAGLLKEKYGFYKEVTIPAGIYNGLDTETDTVSVRATLVASDKLDKERVYEIISCLFENRESLAEGEKKFEELNLQDAVKGIDIPYHEGAARYYREHGLEGF